MADTKISALPASTTPLAGTEVLPIVQSGATKQVSVANLTAGRAISATAVTASTGNFIVGTAGQGIDFSATPGAAGATSELLDDYEEGTWTPTLVSDGGSITNGTNYGFYTKIGRQVTLTIEATAASVSSPSGDLYIFTLPFIKDTATGAASAISVHPFGLALTAITMICGSAGPNYLFIRKYSAGAQSSMAADIQNGSAFIITMTYFTTS
jgi:hypothetical protein